MDFISFVFFLSNKGFSILAKFNFNLEKETKQELKASFFSALYKWSFPSLILPTSYASKTGSYYDLIFHES